MTTGPRRVAGTAVTSGEPAVRLPAPLRERRFALYFIGQLLSQIGDGIHLVTLPFVVLVANGHIPLWAMITVGFFSRPYRNL